MKKNTINFRANGEICPFFEELHSGSVNTQVLVPSRVLYPSLNSPSRLSIMNKVCETDTAHINKALPPAREGEGKNNALCVTVVYLSFYSQRCQELIDKC